MLILARLVAACRWFIAVATLQGLPFVDAGAGIVLMLMVVRLMWSLTAQRRLSVITRTITQARLSNTVAWSVVGQVPPVHRCSGQHFGLDANPVTVTKHSMHTQTHAAPPRFPCSRPVRWRTCSC